MELVNTTSTIDPQYMYNYLNSFVLNPTIFIIIFLIIVAYYVLSSTLVNENNIIEPEKKNGWGILSIIIFIILFLFILVNALQYFFSINVTAYITDIFTNKPKLDIIVDQPAYQPSEVPEIKFRKQVFNIPGNHYNYTNAEAICKAYGAELASYDQIEKAYNNGAEWCNYGWSKNQMALFPTQKRTFDRLQTIKGHEHDCGRTGINGGYIANPQVKFGVNCYGYKPRINEEEEDLMENTTPYPENAQDLALKKRVDYWKNKIDDILVSPFNYDNWSEL